MTEKVTQARENIFALANTLRIADQLVHVDSSIREQVKSLQVQALTALSKNIDLLVPEQLCSGGVPKSE